MEFYFLKNISFRGLTFIGRFALQFAFPIGSFAGEVKLNLMGGLILIPAIIFDNYLFKVDGVIFSLLIAEAISCITGFVLYKIERNQK